MVLTVVERVIRYRFRLRESPVESMDGGSAWSKRRHLCRDALKEKSRRWVGVWEVLASRVEQGEPLVGDGEIPRPGPVLGQAQQYLAEPMHEAPGGVEEPVANAAGFGAGEVAVEANVLTPGEQVSGSPTTPTTRPRRGCSSSTTSPTKRPNLAPATRAW